jgi:hypothetical protein
MNPFQGCGGASRSSGTDDTRIGEAGPDAGGAQH